MTQAIPVQEQRLYTVEEYLDLEDGAEVRSEYDNGQIIEMTGGTIDHNQISGNCYIALSLSLRGQDYRVFMADVKLWIPKFNKATYPDVMVVAGAPEYYLNRRTTITNPSIIIEVLSESTKAYDFNEKLKMYRSIPTLQEHILIDQYKPEIDQYHRVGQKQWSIYSYDEQDTEIAFKSIDLRISIADIYDKVQFETESSPSS